MPTAAAPCVPVFLNFGIDHILRSSSSILQQKSPVELAESDRLSAHVAGVTLPKVCQPRISHIYGKSREDTQINSFLPPWNFFVCPPNCPPHHDCDRFLFGNAVYPSREAIPAAVQRVPLSISFRTRMSGDLYDPGQPVVGQNTSLDNKARGKRKKSWTRAVFSNLQRKGLERSYVHQQYISKKDRRKLAATLGLTDSQVRIWYANRRMKAKKSPKGQSDGRNAEMTN